MDYEDDDYDDLTYDSGPFCKHWSDPEECEECKEEFDPYPELEERFE